MRLMRHRLSPRATILVELLAGPLLVLFLGAGAPSSDAEAAAIACRGAAASCGLATGAATCGAGPGRAAIEPVLTSASLTVTATPCFDSATMPSGDFALSVNS